METSEVALAFGALSQETRIDLLRTLLNAGPDGMAAGEIGTAIGVPASTCSFHLKALEQAGLIAVTRRGRHLIYAAQIARLRSLMLFLVESCCGGELGRCGELAGLFGPVPAGPAQPPAFNVLFLCVGNSARSIMAEAILSKLASGRFKAYSAGSAPSASGPLPEVMALLKALGHDVSGLQSKSWNAFIGPDSPRIDFVIALCDILSGQVCPDFGATTITASWPLPDPARFTGSVAERATLLNEVYAALRRRLEVFISLPVLTLDRMALKARVEELADPHALARN